MMPWGHLAVGYLAYTLGTRIWQRHAPEGLPTLALAFGTQLPDLLDKPLNWWFGISDGRAIGHSVLTTALICGLVFVVARRHGRENLSTAFSIGVFTHHLGDSWQALLGGNFDRMSFLLWPLLPAPTYPKDSLHDHLQQWILYFQALPEHPPKALLASQFGLQLVLLALLIGIWAFDGFPGIETLWRFLTKEPAETDT